MIFWVIFSIIFICFGLVVFRGAPYVPTHRRAVQAMFDALPLKPGDVIVDLGCGDGIVLRVAAKRGYKAVGYEINPILCLIARIRCWPVRDKVTIYWRDFWAMPLPDNAKLVYTFLAGPFMHKFAKIIKRQTQGRELWIASNGFEVPGWHKKRVTQGIYIYLLPEALQRDQ